VVDEDQLVMRELDSGHVQESPLLSGDVPRRFNLVGCNFVTLPERSGRRLRNRDSGGSP
jgi:hypothetical protein